MIHTLNLRLDWELVRRLTEIDRFWGSWAAIEKREGQTLRHLKSIATVRSVGASTRIEGSGMNDDQVKALLENLKSSELEERDAQEVAGYFEALNIISASYRDIAISESSIKSLHNTLLRHSQKDDWHRGNYKQLSNAVEATDNLAGTKQVIFQPTVPGHETEDAMRNLLEWYNEDNETHAIARSAVFVYDFLSIHPFQDGNGRLSRLLATLLLLKHGYAWIEYVSFEHEIEARRAEYYQVLMQCQRQRPGEDVSPWITFFLACLNTIQQSLIKKLETKSRLRQLSPRESSIYSFIESRPGARSSEMAKKLRIPLPTVKRLLMEMGKEKLITKHGIGPGTYYYAGKIVSVKTDLIFKLTRFGEKKEFTVMNPREFVEIKKIILAPRFDVARPEDWANRLLSNGLSFRITATNRQGESVELDTISISGMISPHHYHPVFTLSKPVHIPGAFWEDSEPNKFPIRSVVELVGAGDRLEFEVTVVFDAALD